MKTAFFAILCFICLKGYAQIPAVTPNISPNAKGIAPSKINTVRCKGLINPPSSDLKWRPLLVPKYQESEPKSPDQELIDSIKAQKALLKQQYESQNQNEQRQESVQFVTPVMKTNFLGNTNSGFSPLDNSIAISNGGIIVSVTNCAIEYDDTLGTNLSYINMLTFIQGIDGSITGVCDPVVVYDQNTDRFIFFCQQSPLAASSKIFICFSKNNDPQNGWWAYEITGDPTGNADAFDYPKLAVSTHELFITGNLFKQPSGIFDQAVILQIDKLGGESGASLNYDYFSGITYSPFTLLPVSYGQTGTYGPGIFLVSTNSSSGSSINFYQVTNDICCSPTLNSWQISTTPYSIGADANQLNTSCKLQTRDCRALSGMYLYNAGVGTINFVFHSDAGSGYNGINFNRLNVNTLANTSSILGLAGYDYAYPSVVSYATSPSDQSVMIGFGRSGSTIYPEERVVNCDNSMNWSSSILVKSSQNYVSYTSSTAERWGDYTGTTRKNNSSRPQIWMSGMYGNSAKLWETWIAEITGTSITGINNIAESSNMKVFPNPVVQTFTLDFTLEQTDNIQIDITDINGRLVKQLFKGKGMRGDNVFSFNKANLSAGTYFLNIGSSSKVITSRKIEIVK